MIDRCVHCKKASAEHVEGRCLFAPTTYQNMSTSEYIAYLQGLPRAGAPQVRFKAGQLSSRESNLVVTSSSIRRAKK